MPKTLGKQRSRVKPAQNYGTISGEATEIDADLRAIVEAWPTLPASTKALVLAMVR